MSRIGKKPISIPAGVDVQIDGRQVKVKGKEGELSITHRPEVTVQLNEDSKEIVVAANDETPQARAFHGLTRSLVANMVDGVVKKYEKKLEIVGVGYVAQIAGDKLKLRVGFANEIQKTIPSGLDVSCPDQTHVTIVGCDKQMVGQFAAEVRAVRKPEPYRGKGIRYQDEVVKLKPGKAASK
ncbi:MAG: 50S ribosomal protein L6 [Pirellulaceae bacterium]|nr:50S ribosomal protein L6 [Pirellulaceae bacterium]